MLLPCLSCPQRSLSCHHMPSTAGKSQHLQSPQLGLASCKLLHLVVQALLYVHADEPELHRYDKKGHLVHIGDTSQKCPSSHLRKHACCFSCCICNAKGTGCLACEDVAKVHNNAPISGRLNDRHRSEPSSQPEFKRLRQTSRAKQYQSCSLL